MYVCKHVELSFTTVYEPTLYYNDYDEKWESDDLSIMSWISNLALIEVQSCSMEFFNWTVGKKQWSFPLPLEGTWSIGGLGGITGKLQ